MTARAWWVGLLIIVTLPLGGARGHAETRALPTLSFEAPPRLASVVKELDHPDPERLRQLMELTGLAQPGPTIHVFLAPDSSRLARSAPSWVAGFAVPARDLIVLFPDRTPPYPDDNRPEVLAHEIAHVLMWRAAAGRPTPRWFDEGVAMVGGGWWGLEDRGRVLLAVLRHGEVPLAELNALFGQGSAGASRAYALAGAFVRDLLARHGRDTAARILARVARGERFPEAFESVVGQSEAEAESSFWRRATFWDRWLPFLTSSITLWIGVTLLALWAMHRRRRRDAAMMERWEEEDAWRESMRGGSWPKSGGNGSSQGRDDDLIN